MKIPDAPASANLPYYGNEENGQWQPNGVILDSGVGGGVVGSGDAGAHRPVYPVHIARGHVPGYVMAGAYYPPAYPAAPPAPADDFADYMWMENEEEFDKQVMQQLEEEALMEQCIEAMLEDQQRERTETNGHQHATTSNGTSSLSLEETVSRSTLNPLAAEFVPTRRPPPQPLPDEKPEPQPAEPTTEQDTPKEIREEPVTSTTDEGRREESETDVSETPSIDPPEVSAADIQPITETERRPKPSEQERRPKTTDVRKGKTPAKDTKVSKVATVKSETKVQTPIKKKEVKPVKSESRVERTERTEEKRTEEKSTVEEVPAVSSTTDVSKQSSPPPQEEVSTGPKPINYAAAAKANKPKKPSSPLATDKITPAPLKTEKPAPVAVKPEKTTKPVTKTIKDKPVQRKNSTK